MSIELFLQLLKNDDVKTKKSERIFAKIDLELDLSSEFLCN